MAGNIMTGDKEAIIEQEEIIEQRISVHTLLGHKIDSQYWETKRGGPKPP